MGCWCETDGVTQLPINAGNKVMLFVLERQEYYDVEGRGTCYNTEIWRPIGGAIKGKYDDYGCIEDIVENENTNAVLEELKKGLVPCIEERKAEVLGLTEQMQELQGASLQEILNHIERGYVRYKNTLGTEVQLGLFMVLEEVYKAFTKHDPIVAHHVFGDPVYDKYYEYMPYSQILNMEFEKFYSKYLEHSKKRAQLILELENSSSEEVKLKLQLQDALDDLMLFGMDQRIFDSMYGVNLKCLQAKLVALAKELVPFDDERVQVIVAAVREAISFNSSMVAARKQWSPQTGKGSQSNELDIYMLLNDVTNKIIKKREKQDLEDGSEKPNKKGYTPYMLEHNASLEKNKNGNKETVSPKKEQ